MGVEYKLTFAYPSVEPVANVLRQAPYFSGYDEHSGFYYYRSEEGNTMEDVPDAAAVIEPEGIYFCDNFGGQTAQEVLGFMVQQVVNRFQSVTVQEHI